MTWGHDMFMVWLLKKSTSLQENTYVCKELLLFAHCYPIKNVCIYLFHTPCPKCAFKLQQLIQITLWDTLYLTRRLSYFSTYLQPSSSIRNLSHPYYNAIRSQAQNGGGKGDVPLPEFPRVQNNSSPPLANFSSTPLNKEPC